MKIKEVLILLVFAFILALPLLVSSVRPDGSFLINGSGDNLWHISLSAELKKQIPPSFPGISGTPLKNYHYFSDLIWGLLSKFTGLEITTLYFQIGSFFICFILSLLVFKLAKYFSANNTWSLICVLTTLFIGSAAFVKPLFIKTSSWSGNNFMLDQPYSQLINLHTGIGYILIMAGTLILFKWLSTRVIKYGFFSAIIFALLFGFKAFFAIPISLAFGIICLLQIKETRFKSILPACLLLVLSILVFVSISDRTNINNNSPIEFRSGWLLTKMVEDSDRFNMDGYYLKQLHYESKNNSLRLVQIEVEKILIYVLGNFWIKLLGIIYLITTIKKQTKEKIFLSLAIIISATLPLIIVPLPDPYNTVQFGQIAVLFLGFLLGLFVSSSKIGKFILIILIPVFLFSLNRDFLNQAKLNEFVISKEEINALMYLKHNSDIDAVVIVNPLFDDRKMKVSAFAERRTFYSGGKIPWLLGIDDENRRVIQNQFFEEKVNDKYIQDAIDDYSIDFIYTTADSIFPYPLRYSNSRVNIYTTDN